MTTESIEAGLDSPFRPSRESATADDDRTGEEFFVESFSEASGRPTLRRGSEGVAVVALQRALTAAGFPTEDDGDFGPSTERSVRAFQGSRGLVVDGIVGPLTWAALGAASEPTTTAADRPPAGDRTDNVPDIPLGTLTVDAQGWPSFSYRFTSEDLIWTAKLLVHEAGGNDDPDNAAVLWAMLNRYALFTHRYYPTFTGFIRRYSTTLQPVLRSRRAAERHYRKGDAVYRHTGGYYKGTRIPKGQLVRHLQIQGAPWGSVKASARGLATRALTGRLPNPGIGLASEFASTMVYFHQRYGRRPTKQEWLDYTTRFARSKKWTFIGERGGIDPTKNAFFVQDLVAHLPTDAVRVLPPDGDLQDELDVSASELLEEFETLEELDDELESIGVGDADTAGEADPYLEDADDEAIASGLATQLASADDQRWATSELDNGLAGADPHLEPEEGEYNAQQVAQEQELGPSELSRAVALNERLADRLGWRAHFDRIVTLVGFTDMTPDGATFADAVARWQAAHGLVADGILGPKTWAAMRPAPAPMTSPPPQSGSSLRSTNWLRQAWSTFRCRKAEMVEMSILGTRTPVNPLTTDAWQALERALIGAGYSAGRAWSYKCRTIKGSSNASLHAYGLALDIDPPCHPFRVTPDRRLVRFAIGATQADRCPQVKAGRADTTFTPGQVEAVEAIRTVDGLQVFAWGGRWRTVKDGMHFQINVSPDELRRGILQGPE